MDERRDKNGHAKGINAGHLTLRDKWRKSERERRTEGRWKEKIEKDNTIGR